MTESKLLILSIIKFLRQESGKQDLDADTVEAIEVATQCLESAFNVSAQEYDHSVLDLLMLQNIFHEHLSKLPPQFWPDASEDEKKKADEFKTKGNDMMTAQRFEEAKDFYSNAIDLDRKNALLYGNRAAAYSKLNLHLAAVEDCKRALSIDPNYGKAYGRLGLAYIKLNKTDEALECFRKAISIEPDNESYKNNYKLAEEKLKSQTQERSSTTPNNQLGVSLWSAASEIFADPGLRTMMNDLVSQASTQGSVPVNEFFQAGNIMMDRLRAFPGIHSTILDSMASGATEGGLPFNFPPPTGNIGSRNSGNGQNDNHNSDSNSHHTE